MSISIVFARAIVAELSNRKLDAQELLRRSAIDPARLADIREFLQVHEYERLITLSISMTNDPGLGLAVGAHDADNAFQLFGHLFRVQPTMREAFATHIRYAGLVARGPVWQLNEEGDLAYVSLSFTQRAGLVRTFFMEHAMTAGTRLGRLYFPRLPAGQTSLHAVHFQHERPGHAEKYNDYFRCPVLFGQHRTAVVFPRVLLDRPQPHADPMIDRMLRESAERLLQQQSRAKPLNERVRLLLRYSLELPEIRADRVARYFGLTVRTLRRRLAAEGHSLSELVDEARCRVACDALLRDDMSMLAVAEMLGFSEPSAFFRAFKRWTGRTPGEYRKASSLGELAG